MQTNPRPNYGFGDNNQWIRDVLSQDPTYLAWLSRAQSNGLISMEEYRLMISAHNLYISRMKQALQGK